jgi:hypothetical protein
MPGKNVKRLVLPTIVTALLPHAAAAATMSDERVCRYETIVACNAIGDADPYLCGDERPAFTLTAIASGASQYAFEFTSGGREKEYFRGSNFGFGPTFKRGSAAYTLGQAGEMPVLLVIRSRDGKPVTAESWVGACDVQSIDIDAIEQGANGR